MSSFAGSVHNTAGEHLFFISFLRCDAVADALQRVLHAEVCGIRHFINEIAFVGGNGIVDADHTAVAVTFILGQNVNGRIGVIRDLRLAGLVVHGDLQIQNDGVIGAAAGAIAKEISQGIGHQLSRRLVEGDLVDHMGMGADDGIHALLLHQGGDGLLGTADGIIVFAAPVQQGHCQIRLFRLRTAQDLCDPVRIDILIGSGVVGVQQIHAVFVAGRHTPAVHTLGEGDKGDFDAIHLTDGVTLCLAELLRGGEGTHRLQAGRPDIAQSRDQTCLALYL